MSDVRLVVKELKDALNTITSFPADWAETNDLDNCQVLCRRCHADKTHGVHRTGTGMGSRGDLGALMSKADRIREKHLGIRKSKYKWGRRPMGNPVRD
jgi:hypothetical protein